MKNGGSDPHQRGRDHNRFEAGAKCQQEHAAQGERHPGREGIRLRPPIGVEADRGLQQRCRDLVDQRDQTDLAEAEPEGLLDHGIDRWQQRLHHVVQKVAEAETGENACSHLWRQKFDHRGAIVNVTITSGHSRMEIALDETGVRDVGGSAFQDVPEEDTRDASEAGRHLVVEVSSQRG